MYLVRGVDSDELLEEVCPSGGDQQGVDGAAGLTGCYDSYTALVGNFFSQDVPHHCEIQTKILPFILSLYIVLAITVLHFF